MSRRASVLLVVSIVFTTLTPAAVGADHTGPPTSVTIAGSLQSELGCPGDWQADCAATHLAARDGAFAATFTLPAGAWEYKAALNDWWDESYGTGGSNVLLNLASSSEVTFYYSHVTHWVTDNQNSRIVTVPGSFQTELGCAGDWDPTCLGSWLQDVDGDGVFTMETDTLGAGAYEAKVAIDEAWDENYGAGGVAGGANIAFTVEPNSVVTFSFESSTNILTVTSVPSTSSPVAVAGSLQDELGCPGDWQPDCDLTEIGYDAEDDVYAGAFNLPAGSFEYKVALNDSWDENYGAGGVLNGPNIGLNLPEPSDVTFYFDPVTKWATDDVNSLIVTAVGSFQSELGCGGDWDPTCLRSWLQDADGDGIYTYSTDEIPAGNHEAKATVGQTWDENYGEGGVLSGANIAFTSFGRTVDFSWDSFTKILTIVAEGLPGIDNDVRWDELGHDSRDGLYRNPGGAVVTDSDVVLRLRAGTNDLEAATVRLWNDRDNAQAFVPMSMVLDDGTYQWWETTINVGEVSNIWWYRFIAQDGEAVAYFEDDDARTGGWGQTYGESQDNSWALTVHDPDFATPDWVKNAVIYQIFPDRFRDGDASNNTPEGSFFYEERGTELRSGGTDWNTPICDPRGATDVLGPDGVYVDCALLYSQNFYGGDLQGIIDQLDYLEDLGVTALYLNPIFESPSNHRYDTTDFLTIEDSLGDLDTFVELATEADKRDMHLILDGVFNHTSSDSVYFDRYGRYEGIGACESADSDFRTWYYFQDDPTGPCDGADYESWFGFDSLPKLNSSVEAVRELVWADVSGAAVYWMQWADGWRLDVAGDVDPGVTGDPTNDYWEGFRSAVRSANPDAYIVGEEWRVATSWTLGEEWDATMNYQFSSAVLGFWRDTPFVDNDHNAGSSAGVIDPLEPSELVARLANLEERYPYEAWLAMMNLLGSHDTNRALFMLDENAATGADDTLLDDPAYDWSDAIDRLGGVAILQMTLPGAPTIYYGDEVGLVGPVTYDGSSWQDDPYNRVAYPWLDETGTPYYSHLQTAAGQGELLDHYQMLTAARHDHPALRTGSMVPLLVDDDADVLVYGRFLDEKRSGPAAVNADSDKADAAMVAVNSGDADVSVVVDVAGHLAAGVKLVDVLTNTTYRVGSDGTLAVTVPAGSGVVLVPTHQIASEPHAVTGLAVTNEGPGTAALSWMPVDDRIAYDIWRSPLSGGGYELVGSTGELFFIDVGLTNAQAYHYVVVARDTKTLLTSDPSAEVMAVPHYEIGWANLQWPPTITHVISTEIDAGPVYGQIWIDGVTSDPGATPSVTAQVGFGPDGSMPDDGWTWSDMAFNGDAGNNDEFFGPMAPDAIGDYDYAVRWSTDGGRSWLVVDTGGPGYDSAEAGQMTVVASSDVVAPDAPAASLIEASASSITIGWTVPSDDVAVAGFELYRDGVEVAQLGAGVTSYGDGAVATGQTYSYEVVAFDTSWNRSLASNAVIATAEAVVVDVTFRVTVPASTPPGATVYIAGSFPAPYPEWNPGGISLAATVDPFVWEVTLAMLEGTVLEYKYTRGSWDEVEKGPDCEEIANRTLTVIGSAALIVDDTVVKWRDVDGCG